MLAAIHPAYGGLEAEWGGVGWARKREHRPACQSKQTELLASSSKYQLTAEGRMGWERLRVGKGESEPRICTWGRSRGVPSCLNAEGLTYLEERSLVGSCPALSPPSLG